MCDENEPCCLDYHHIDPSGKVGNISKLSRSRDWVTIINEINKCILLCANCHRKLHRGVLSLNDKI